MIKKICFLVTLSALFVSSIYTDDAELAKQSQNPLGSIISAPAVSNKR